MKYNNSTIRRQDRVLNEENALQLLKEGEYGFLSMITEDGAYGIPLNYVWDGKDHIYIHCAPEGKKLRAISSRSDISFCVVGKTQVLAKQFSTAYESIIVSGKAFMGLPTEEKWKALRLLVEKYSPQYKEIGDKYIEKSFERTEVIRIEINEISGKTKETRL